MQLPNRLAQLLPGRRELTRLALVSTACLGLFIQAASAEPTSSSYRYDAAGRLVETQIGDRTITYEYDPAGNLLSRTVPEPGILLELAAGAALVLLGWRRRHRGTSARLRSRPSFPSGMLLVIGTGLAPALDADAHDCKNPVVQMVKDQVNDTLLLVDADFEEVTTEYTLTVAPISPGAQALVVPAGMFDAHDAIVNITAQQPGVVLLTTAWFYEPTFVSGICTTLVTISDNSNFSQSGRSGDPVNTFTGELEMRESSDLEIPGPLPLVFQRRYTSGLRRAFVISRIGDNWRHNFDWTIHFTGNVLVIIDHRGRVTRYLKPNTITNEWVQQTNLDAPLPVIQEIQPTDNHFHVFDPSTRLIYQFSVPPGDIAFRLVEIRDERGSALSLSYNDDFDLARVTDDLGRELRFTYDVDPNPATRKLRIVTDGLRSVNFTYDGDLLTQFQDANGNFTQYVYDTTHSDSGLLRFKVWPAGNIPVMNTWDSRGRVATQADADGNVTTFTYADGAAAPLQAVTESTDRRTTITGPDAKDVVHDHDSEGRLTKVTDQESRERVMTSDLTGRRSSAAQPSGAAWSRSYESASGYPAIFSDGDGESIRHDYQSRMIAPGFEVQDLAAIVYPDGRSITFTYDANGNQLTRTNRAGETWTNTFDSRGQPLTLANPAGGVLTFTYNADGTRATEMDPASHVTQFAYDTLFRLTRVTRADGTTREFTYDNLNHITSIKTEDGNTTIFTLNPNGDITAMMNPAGDTATIAYDANNRVASRTDRTGASIDYTHDARGLPASATLSDGGGTYTFTYGDAQQITSLTLPDGTGYQRGYDLDRAPTQNTNDLGETESVVLSPAGRVVSRTDEGGNVYGFGYDSLGFLTSRTFPTGESEVYTYNALDRIASIQLQPGGPTSGFGYNSLGQITAVTDPNGEAWAFGFDNQGLLRSSTDPLGRARTFGYDTRNRVSQVTLPDALGTEVIEYDGIGLVTRRGYSDGTELLYSYDAVGRLTATKDVTLAYDSESRVVASNGIAMTRRPHSGEITSATLAPGKTLSYRYDAAGRLAAVEDWAGGSVGFEYDAAGQLVRITRSNGIPTTFVYDGPGRVTSLQHGALGSILVTRDAGGRITSQVRDLPGAPASPSDAVYAFDAASQVQSFGYDALGRRTQDDRHQYTWSLASRLTEYARAGETASFGYDGLGLMVSRDAGTSMHEYVWHLGLELPSVAVLREAGQDSYYYVHHPSGRLLYSIAAADDSRHFYHFDERGNTVILSDDVGGIVASYEYSPYGVPNGATPAVDNPFTFGGEYGMIQEGETGLYVTRTRVYDSHTARFLSREPMGPHLHPTTVNPYQYAAGNPYSFFDPAGTDPNGVDEAAQEGNALNTLDNAADVLRGATNTAGVVGNELADKADDLAKAANKSLGAALTLTSETNKVIKANLGGNAATSRVINTIQKYEDQFRRFDSQANKLSGQANRLKAIARAGRVLNAVEVGAEIWKLHGRLSKVREGHDALEIQLYKVYLERSATAWDIYARGKITLPTLRLWLNNFKREMQLELLRNDYLSLLDGTIHFWTAVGNIYGAFVPGYSLVGTEAVSQAAHQHVWAPIHRAIGD